MNTKADVTPKHEVAFSFLHDDLQIATKFAGALEPLTSFIYACKQQEIAGTDGQESFRAAFLDSRLNVILLRAGWGETPWTRVEQAAIQDRCLKDGWNRLLVIKLDGSCAPNWMPAVNLYLDLTTFPFEQAVGAIKHQVQQLGGEVRAPSQIDIARAKLREADFQRETETLFRTPEGVKQADAAFRQVVEHLRMQLQRLADSSERKWEIVADVDGGSGVVRAETCSTLLRWERYSDNCVDGELRILVIPAAFETPTERRAGKSLMRLCNPDPVSNQTYKVTRRPALGIAWKRGNDLLTAEQVASAALSKMIDVLVGKR